MSDLVVNGIAVEDTFAEAFGMKATRVIVTARNLRWAKHAAEAMTGFATSVIACGCEAGIERELDGAQTPDGRPGVAVLLFSVSTKELTKQVERRVGQCVLTAPTSACFAGIEGGEPLPLGRTLRFFGDGFQISKLIGGRRYWRVPVMDGEFLCEETTGMVKAVGGGNFLVLARDQDAALAACEAAIEAMRRVPGVIMPFPGGVVRSGSKVGSRRSKTMIASSNDAFCPTLRPVTATALADEVNSVLEIVINGTDAPAIARAMRAGIDAACREGVVAISAGNYGGKLGQFQFPLREILA